MWELLSYYKQFSKTIKSKQLTLYMFLEVKIQHWGLDGDPRFIKCKPFSKFNHKSLYSLIWDFFGVHIKNPMKNSYQDGLGRMTQTLDHVVVVHILMRQEKISNKRI
jgi:hypothetical protein